METKFRKLPIGVQDFEDIRTNGYLYVDKTMYVHKLITQGKPYFLSRPRRFGKSLFLSTLKAYFEGKRELFEGLAITELMKDDPDAFAKYPVFYFDFNRGNYSKPEAILSSDMQAIEMVFDMHLREWEQIYGFDPANKTLALRFDYLLKESHRQTGRRGVVLVDEYDKALLEQIEDKGYALPYAADPRKILKIGVNFDSERRNITEWIVD